jgi:hypothetical protein
MTPEVMMPGGLSPLTDTAERAAIFCKQQVLFLFMALSVVPLPHGISLL